MEDKMDIDIDKDLLKSCYKTFCDVNKTHYFPMRYSWETLTINTRDDTLLVVQLKRKEVHIKHLVYDENVNISNTHIITDLKYIVKDEDRNKLQNVLEEKDYLHCVVKKKIGNIINNDIIKLILDYTEDSDERLLRLIDKNCKNFSSIMDILYKNNIKYVIDNNYL